MLSPLRRFCSGLFSMLCALGALHCDDGPLILEAPPAAPDENTTGDGEQPGQGGSGGTGGAPSAPDAVCQPRAIGGPFSVTEGDTIEIRVECATGAALPGEAFTFVEPPPNAALDPTSLTITFTPALDQAGLHTFRVVVVESDESVEFQVEVIERPETPDEVAVDPLTLLEESGLPVLHLSVDPAINDGEYLPAAITYRGHRFVGAQAKYRGQTSLKYPKKSFTLKFTKDDRFGDPLAVAGFGEKRKVTLTTTFDDNSYLRARLAFELWNRLGVGHVQVQAYHVVVYLNGAYWGLYTLTDHVDRRLMEDHGLSEAGNLYKARTHDANFRLTRFDDLATPKLSLSEGYTKEEGTPLDGEPGAFADLEALVTWVASSSDDAFLAELDSRVVQREYENWWLLVSLIMADDSVGKNSYHYRDPSAGADGRFHVVPWDFNDSFGQSWLADHAGREANQHPEELAAYNLLFERLLTLPASRAALVERFRSAFANEWALGSVLEAVDAFTSEIEAASLRDEAKWDAPRRAYFSAYHPSFTTHAEEVAYLRRWISERWAHVASHY